MRIKQIMLCVILALSTVYSFAGNEDWNGAYNFQDDQGKTYSVTHSPTRISFMFFTSNCVELGKGVHINGFEVKQDVRLCTHTNIADFTNEVQKLGLVTKKDITVGATYQDQ